MRIGACPPRVSVVHADQGGGGGGASAQPEDQSKPLHLTATCTINPGSSSGVNAVALQNPLGTPMEIHEIKWSASALSNPVNTSGIKAQLLTKVNGAALRCRLDLGKIEITNGYVPVCLFGKGEHESMEQILLRVGSGSPADGESLLEFRWKLSHPLFVPAGGLLAPSFEHGGQITAPIQVRIGYSARSLPMNYRPQKLIMPWVASYISDSFDLAVASTFNSTELDLVNKWDTLLTVDRLSGRLSVFDSTSVAVFDSAYMGLTALNMRMVDSAGNAIVRAMSPFSHVFHNTLKTWETRSVLPAKGYYQAFFQSSVAPTISAGRYFTQALVGLVGSREVK